MTKNEYIKRLKEKLIHLPLDQVDDILYDYEEHFQIGIENGKTEDEIAIELGKPEMIAAQYRYSQVLNDLEMSEDTMESRLRRKYANLMDEGYTDRWNGNAYSNPRSTANPHSAKKKRRPFKLVRAMLTAIGLGFFNIVFVLGLYLGVIGVLIGLFVASIALSISGIVVLFYGVFPFVPGIASSLIPSIYTSLMLISGGLAMIAGGTLAILLLYRGAVGMYNWTLRYLRTNLNIIRKAGE